MQFVDLGFLFLLLPMSAAGYYCFPSRFKAAALLVISLFFCYLMSPQSVWLAIPVGIDCAAIAYIRNHPDKLEQNDFLLRLCLLKNTVLMVVLGIAVPVLNRQRPPVGLMVVLLSLTELLVQQKRQSLATFSPVATAGAALFFGRLVHGPVNGVGAVTAQLVTPSPSLSRIARGVMLVIAGITKQVVLSEQLAALVRTISRLSPDQFSLALGWFCALCSALSVYFSLSAFSDIAMGIGNIFSLKLPRILYYPFQARSIREYIYRLNMPLEDTIASLVFPETKREKASGSGYIISFFMPLLLGFWIAPSGSGFSLWGSYLALLVLLDWIFIRHIPNPFSFAARITTFIMTLPAYIFMVPAPLANRFDMLFSMVGLQGVPVVNDAVVYLFYSNFVLLAIGVLCCSNVFDVLGRATERQFPNLWWIVSSSAHLGLLIISASFLLGNVR